MYDKNCLAGHENTSALQRTLNFFLKICMIVELKPLSVIGVL